MNQIMVLYLQTVGKIGASISETGDKFGSLSATFSAIPNKTIEDIRDLKRAYELLLEEFKGQEQRLSITVAPSLLKSGHSKMLSAFGEYVKATELAIQSLDTENGTVNAILYQESMNKQQQSAKEIVLITNEMVDEIKSAK
jgi:hypothetical protein